MGSIPDRLGYRSPRVRSPLSGVERGTRNSPKKLGTVLVVFDPDVFEAGSRGLSEARAIPPEQRGGLFFSLILLTGGFVASLLNHQLTDSNPSGPKNRFPLDGIGPPSPVT